MAATWWRLPIARPPSAPSRLETAAPRWSGRRRSRRQLPASAGIHPSAFAWLNTKGALGIFSALSPSPAVNGLLAEHDPVLVVFDGKPEQIHVASRTRLSGAIIDAMMLESLSRTLTPPQPKTTRH